MLSICFICTTKLMSPTAPAFCTWNEPNRQPSPVLCYMYTKSSQGCLPRPQVKIPPMKVKENAEMPSRRLMVSRNVEREFGENATGFCPSLDGSRKQKGVIVEVECPGRGMKDVCVI